ncbi:hypothetical protein T07_10069 [Trichinella nelsoni]|uniref:Uncharacterized protein n=1 Tax=Trichinella nelsoni TaxID=6336 RepID=A0A0V0S9I7_9BILA|nr:hypothetical protein T07_10069 [Trichinella nelsoni]
MQQFFIKEVLNRKSHEVLRKATFIFEKFGRIAVHFIHLNCDALINLSYEKIDCLLFKPSYLQVNLPYILALLLTVFPVAIFNFVVLFKSLICRFTERPLRHYAMSAVLSLLCETLQIVF